MMFERILLTLTLSLAVHIVMYKILLTIVRIQLSQRLLE